MTIIIRQPIPEWSAMSRQGASIPFLLLLAAVGCIAKPIPPRDLTPAASLSGASSIERMLTDTRALAAIGAHLGWRTAGSPGEAQAFDYVAAQLDSLADGDPLRIELTRQSYRLPVGSHIHESRLWLDAGQGQVEVPADAICCSRRADATALFFDSDGKAGDDFSNPVDVAGIPRLVAAVKDVSSLQETVAIVDFSLVDTYVHGTEAAARNALALLEARPSAIVLITQFSNRVGALTARRLPWARSSRAWPTRRGRPSCMRDWRISRRPVSSPGMTWEICAASA
jgi:hypothetical protein